MAVYKTFRRFLVRSYNQPSCIYLQKNELYGLIFLLIFYSNRFLILKVTDERSCQNLTVVNPVAMAQEFKKASGAPGRLRTPRTEAVCESAYPSTGSANPTTEIRYLEIDLDAEPSKSLIDYRLKVPITDVLDWVEYIVKYGWLDGGGLWALVLNREQNKAALIYLPLNAFSSEGFPTSLILIFCLFLSKENSNFDY